MSAFGLILPFKVLEECVLGVSLALRSFSLIKVALLFVFSTASVACFVSSGFSLLAVSIFRAVGCLTSVSNVKDL